MEEACLCEFLLRVVQVLAVEQIDLRRFPFIMLIKTTTPTCKFRIISC